MILVEGTLWPLIVVGLVSDGDRAPEWITPVNDERLRSSDSVRLAVIVSGAGSRAKAAHDAVFEWLLCHKAVLNRRTFRMAWIIEDETLRACAQAWQALVGDRVLGAESGTFRALGPALRWLMHD